MKVGTKLKAKCPKCSVGCTECQDGFVEVYFGKEDMVYYDLVCNVCETVAGGGFAPPDKFSYEIKGRPVCPGCGSNKLRKEIS